MVKKCKFDLMKKFSFLFLNRVVISFLLLLFFNSCAQKEFQDSIVNKISKLDEFKIAQSRVDSMKKEGINADISISVLSKMDGFLYSEDSLKNISYTFIEESFGFSNNILYTVKFIDSTKTIVEVISNAK